MMFKTTDGYWVVSDWWCKSPQTWVTSDAGTALNWCYNASMDSEC
ncbi:MAG TPA: hypothetical protein VJ623_11965 [Holophagaceae bacterium]|nr:hypothetical protein [Holophagaceae bacterium]